MVRMTLQLMSGLLFVGITAGASQAENSSSWPRSLLGDWQGTLEYRDYAPPHGRVRLPTTLAVTPGDEPAAVVLTYTYDDGPGKTVTSVERLRVDPASGSVDWNDLAGRYQQQFRITESTDGERLVLTMTGKDDGRPADIRVTLSIRAGRLIMLKETGPVGQPLQFRHEYQLTRREAG